MNDTSEQDLQKVAYELSLRAFAQQETALDELRRRTEDLRKASKRLANWFLVATVLLGLEILFLAIRTVVN